MQKLIKPVLLVLISTLFVLGCNKQQKSDHDSDPTVDSINYDSITEDKVESSSKTDEIIQTCYQSTFKGSPIMDGKDTLQQMIDTNKVQITYDEDKVTGQWYYLPAEKDAMVGTFIGTLVKPGHIEAMYHFTQEGDAYHEPIEIQVNEKKVQIRFKVNSGDAFSEWQVLPRIDCNRVSFP